MSSGTSTDSSSFRPWHLFVLTALVAATAAILVSRPSDPVVAVLLTAAAGAAGFVGLMLHRTISPLVRKDFREPLVMAGTRTRAAVEREKTLVLRSIKELEFDRAMGKVSDRDFDEMGGRLRARAIRLMKQLDIEPVDIQAMIERELQERLGASEPRASAGAAVTRGVCKSCATANDSDARFCKGCGQPLLQTDA